MTWFRYIRHERIAAYEALGWVIVDDLANTHHGDHAVLGKWAGEGEPKEP
jgi:hypothetical protein